ncbi:MAG: ABC transporter ATP-binding protein [Deltaproteobacteria bacterium]|nr:ABC transporter ATP-binding protein [Deltaproteobacteria bacterium]MBW1923740.1 ABC transporter ATP-binding protein [Deltaproteobacteria bacterium]MBW1949001.1 ABC transporter ATP-binding protein [Deltaproteobacteria bacterium]MBW2007005.1 ABC transporter ATP-binding protein [Deltaproteobacteria bacterium]MBW2101634.1 ABC transporter ATP-binding protein [Deltaproteobacteria bacterium]
MRFFEVKNLVKYFGGLAAVNDVSFEVKEGEIFGLIGPNGSGKTTIFNLISNFHSPTSGSVLFKGRDITGLKTHRICKARIARTFQVVKPLGRMTVLDNVVAAAFSRAKTKHEARDLAMETLEFCGLAHRKDMLAKSLPIGERKRLEITRAMATLPELLLLDETAAGLNPSELVEAIDLIRKIREKGVTIIIVEHIMKVIMTISDRIHAINFGRTIAEGTPGEVANHPAVIEAYLGEAYARG